MNRRGWRLAVTALVAVAGAVSACGDDDGDSGAAGQADRAFLEAMVPHHESAIAMARVARRRAEHPQITELAQAIVATQSHEISQLKNIHRRLFDEPLMPNEDAHESLGLSADAAGMGHMESVSDLKRADPFDEAFIDEMVAHHQGAIRMARAVQDETTDEEIRSLADAIVTAQSKEIEEMNQWRKAWFEDGSTGEHDGH